MYVGKQLRVSTYAKAAEDRLVKKTGFGFGPNSTYVARFLPMAHFQFQSAAEVVNLQVNLFCLIYFVATSQLRFTQFVSKVEAL